MAGLTFDSGFLIAIDRDERAAWAFFRAAVDLRLKLTVPAPVVAQSWRGERNVRMTMLLRSVEVDDLDEDAAKRTGELLGASGSGDVVDAFLVLGASRRGDRTVTGDVSDIRRLESHVQGLGLTIDLNALPRL